MNVELNYMTHLHLWSNHTCDFLGVNYCVNYSHNNGLALYQMAAFTPAILQTISITMQPIVMRIVHAIVHA